MCKRFKHTLKRIKLQIFNSLARLLCIVHMVYSLWVCSVYLCIFPVGWSISWYILCGLNHLSVCPVYLIYSLWFEPSPVQSTWYILYWLNHLLPNLTIIFSVGRAISCPVYLMYSLCVEPSPVEFTWYILCGLNHLLPNLPIIFSVGWSISCPVYLLYSQWFKPSSVQSTWYILCGLMPASIAASAWRITSVNSGSSKKNEINRKKMQRLISKQ